MNKTTKVGTKKYWTLLVMIDGKWSIHFGDYEKQAVMDERTDVLDSGEVKRTQIVMTEDSQVSIEEHVKMLNKSESRWS